MRIVAIGGGELRGLETIKLDQHIVNLTGKRNPSALFIPTASGDATGYEQTFASVYGDRLGCKVQTLRLLSERPSPREIKQKIASAEVIYVGGGNTLRMMRRWRALGVDRELMAAAKRNTVLAGLSAGAICWFQYGHSDSRSFSGNSSWSPIRVRGLGLVPLLYCPHYREEKREKSLKSMLLAHGGAAIACDSNAAIEVRDRQYRIIKASDRAKVYYLSRVNGKIGTKELSASDRFEDLEKL